jgi:hypothetical protein
MAKGSIDDAKKRRHDPISNLGIEKLNRKTNSAKKLAQWFENRDKKGVVSNVVIEYAIR